MIDEESRLLKKINKCLIRKCSKYNKELRKTSKILRKEQDKECPGFNDNDCLDKVYNKSNYKRTLRNHINCGKKKCKCSKERKTLRKFSDVREKLLKKLLV